MINVVDRITGDGTFRALLARIRELTSQSQPPPSGDGTGVVSADGLWGSFAPTLAGTIAAELNRPLLYITAHLEQADEVRDDLELFCGQIPELLSAFETLPGEGAASEEIHAERIQLCARLHQEKNTENLNNLIVVAPIQSLMQAVPTPEAMQANLLSLTVAQQHDTLELADWLASHGFTRLDQVESPGDFALRGDILDIYPPGQVDPYRIDFFGDTIESIRRFDVSTQRSQTEFQTIRIAGMPTDAKQTTARKSQIDANITNFLTYMPADTIIAFAEPIEIQELGRTFWNRLDQPQGMIPVEHLFQRAGNFLQLHLSTMPTGETSNRFSFGIQSLTRFETKTTEALGELNKIADRHDVLFYCDNEPERQRFVELWQNTIGPIPDRLHLAVGLMHHGFDWPAGRLAVIGHHQLFHRYQQRRRIRKTHAARPIESWLDLHIGDLVVHVVHGIARFLGMRTMGKSESGKTAEYLTLEFAEKAKLHVPVTQIDLVQKYVGAGPLRPQLSKLGGTRWAKIKERVTEAVDDMASELLRIQATRASQTGINYPIDTTWQREFEGSFIYTETEDQLTTLIDIKKDMQKPQPMDRRLCGDVGYGKTELAIRAAFKVVEYGKQVAVLVPTTVLAEQHERTFRERLADFPFIVECLSRFKTKKQQQQIIAATRKGQIDILIGTHRILSKDVGFKDLGLLVIDEEQRFGVEHKERLKRFRETVDVLTMSATPIPRTLHMSLIGIRDISSLATPPLDRRSIVTQVCQWNDTLIRNAILREMNRDGQIYFVHNYVNDIQSFADTVQQIVPEARILVGHGQMSERQLEKVMLQFVRHQVDVLVSTTIIESGLDIPNCNTILIDRADRFGLSELHQLRGRVGRYKHRAYCYLLLSPHKSITPIAAKRLKAIEEYSDLGAGFRIAMRDLEIRGAGNILGPEQSGHIAAVGYELYCELLDAAVRRLKEGKAEVFQPVHLELNVHAHIPRNYISSDRQRMEIYRRLARCRTSAELEQLEKDIKDAFGPYGPTVQTMLNLAEIRILAQPYKIKSIAQQQPDLIFSVEDLSLIEPIMTDGPGSARMADAHTVHLRLPEAYFETDTMLAVLRHMLQPAAVKSKMPNQ
ncbi:MAG: transcription-repair coupling factor [Planctomycetota bacterium]|nr:MAG: transcription-repair coupling factor [Planctomycetota bacterium]